MTLFASTELGAVNVMLAGIGGAEVTTLEDETIEDATMALSILRQVSREFQTSGWHFNTGYDYPVTAVHVDAVDIEDRDLVKRGDFLYDWENRTFTFSGSNTIKCKIGSATSSTCPR